MDLGLNGRGALVMGASKGIGRAIAEALAREGALVAAASRSGEGPPGTTGLEAETSDLERMAALPGEAAETLGTPIAILVTNTGGPPPGASLDNDIAEWEAAYRNLVLAPRVLVEAALPAMCERGFGRIVNVGSTSTIEPLPHLSLSNSHRLGLVALFKTLAREVAGQGITLNTVATGLFATERIAGVYGSLTDAQEAAKQNIPAGRLGEPAEYGDLVAFLCSERAAYLTGTVIPLDGGALRSI